MRCNYLSLPVFQATYFYEVKYFECVLHWNDFHLDHHSNCNCWCLLPQWHVIFNFAGIIDAIIANDKLIRGHDYNKNAIHEICHDDILIRAEWFENKRYREVTVIFANIDIWFPNGSQSKLSNHQRLALTWVVPTRQMCVSQHFQSALSAALLSKCTCKCIIMDGKLIGNTASDHSHFSLRLFWNHSSIIVSSCSHVPLLKVQHNRIMYIAAR